MTETKPVKWPESIELPNPGNVAYDRRMPIFLQCFADFLNRRFPGEDFLFEVGDRLGEPDHEEVGWTHCYFVYNYGDPKIDFILKEIEDIEPDDIFWRALKNKIK